MKSHPILTSTLFVLSVVLWVYALGGGLTAQSEGEHDSQVYSTKDFATNSRNGISESSPQISTETSISGDSSPHVIKEQIPAADQLLAQARNRLVQYHSIQMNITEQLVLADQIVQMTGQYVQGTNLRLRMDLKVKVGETEGTLEEVCDGHVLWTQRKIGESVTVTRRDVRQIFQVAMETNSDHLQMQVAELSMGGLPALMASLEKHLEFSKPHRAITQGHELFVLEGVWKPDFRTFLAGTNKNPVRLPPGIPDAVHIFLDQENLFPRRIQYLKQSAATGQLERMANLDFSRIRLNDVLGTIPFDYVPPEGLIPLDLTSKYLSQLKNLSPASQTAEKK